MTVAKVKRRHVKTCKWCGGRIVYTRTVFGGILAGDADTYRLTKERAQIVGVPREHGEPMTPTEVPIHLRGGQTPSGMKQARIGAIARAGSGVGKELAAKKAELAEIEGVG